METKVSNKTIQETSRTTDYKILSLQIAHCRAEIDNQKSSINEEIDNELNKINIWITIVVLIMGILNIAFTISNNHLASLIKDDMDKKAQDMNNNLNAGLKTHRDELEESMRDTKNQIKTVSNEIECLWCFSSFTIDNAIKEFKKNGGSSSLLRLLKKIKSNLSGNNNTDHEVQFLQFVKNQLFNDDLSLTLPEVKEWVCKVDIMGLSLEECIMAEDSDYKTKLSEFCRVLDDFINAIEKPSKS